MIYGVTYGALVICRTYLFATYELFYILLSKRNGYVGLWDEKGVNISLYTSAVKYVKWRTKYNKAEYKMS